MAQFLTAYYSTNSSNCQEPSAVVDLFHMRYITYSEKETVNLGKKLALKLRGGDVVCLYGDLGAGKTTLVKGIAKGLGVKEEITSPTFTLMNVYQINNKQINKFVHIDTYRLKKEQELVEIGVEDYLGELGIVCVVEWPQKTTKVLRGKKIIKVVLKHTGEGEREIIF